MTNLKINDKNRTIELSNTFAKAASIFGSDEYKDLQEARRDYPNYRVITVKQKSTSNDSFVKLSIKDMDKYIATHNVIDELKAEYRSLRGLDDNGVAVNYQTIKDWFMNAFPEFEQFHTDRMALLEKIQADKEARLAARKKTA